MDTLLIIVILIVGFYTAWNIGANDVANAMGTSVGSGALRLKQDVIVAACLEFLGAFIFGSHVAKTIQSDIIDPSYFLTQPRHLVYGMLTALASAGLWLQIASYFGFPVSTTHSIVGAVVGVGMAVGGIHAVFWDEVFTIVSSWVLSPFLGAIFAYVIFTFIRKNIFYSQSPLEKTRQLAPFLLASVIFILFNVLIFEGLKNIGFNSSLFVKVLIVSVVTFISFFCGNYFFSRTLQIKKDYSIHDEYQEVERIFGYLQISSACMMAFAHGANDVANAIGPMSAAISILTTGSLSVQTPVPLWALFLGGLGIVIGLSTWGWRVIETVGKKITELTPTRGFSAEFGAAITIVLASYLGLPISTTHVLVGAVLGVGFARGLGSINLNTTRDILISWMVTVPLGAFFAILLYYPINYIFG